MNHQTATDRYRVLIVEDDPYIARLVLTSLQKANLECRVSADGIQGLADFRDYNPHLVLTDIMMPGLDGRSMCATIREQSAVPILLMTAADTSEAEMAAFKAGADDYIPKPFDPKLLTMRVMSHLRRVYRYDAQAYGTAEAAPAAAAAPAPAAAPAGSPDVPETSEHREHWMTCATCGHMGPTTVFRQENPRGERIVRCPHCGEREHFSYM